jgi:hypothetical protein
MYSLHDIVYVMGFKPCGLSLVILCRKNVKCIVNIPSAELKAKARLMNAYELQWWARIMVWLLYFVWYAYVYVKACINRIIHNNIISAKKVA